MFRHSVVRSRLVRTNKSQSLTYTVASSFVSTEPLAAMTPSNPLVFASLLGNDPRISEQRNCAREDATAESPPATDPFLPECRWVSDWSAPCSQVGS